MKGVQMRTIHKAVFAGIVSISSVVPVWAQQQPDVSIPGEPIQQLDEPELKMMLIESARLIHANEARQQFNVDGAGLTIAVLDTGLRVTHKDFQGRVVTSRNFTTDNGNDPNNANDGNGHGTNVGGIAVAGDIHIGIAPRGSIIPLKVLSNTGGGSNANIASALKWVIDNREQYKITVVCMSLGGSTNHTDDAQFATQDIAKYINVLRAQKVAVVIAAGNDFFRHQSKEGMSFPGIVRGCVSVGAVYDANVGKFEYQSGAVAMTTDADRITPFTQRLHESTAPAACRTDIFAPGAPVTSSGIANDTGESIQHGTSQAAPMTAGCIMLLQQFYLRTTGDLPTVDQLENYMRTSATRLTDGDDEDDNVQNTNKQFPRVDVLAALSAVQRDIAVRAIREKVTSVKSLE
jgi:subtilisin family serine protease